MYKLFYNISILLLLALPCKGQNSDFKQLNKAIRKIWNSNETDLNILYSRDSNGLDKPLNGYIYSVEKDKELLGYAYSGRVYSCRAGGCSSEQPIHQSAEDYEYFDYIILFNSKLKVETIRVINYQASHGQEICSPAWLKQFKGYDGKSNLEYGGDIDAISGATISAISILVDIERIASQLSELINIRLQVSTKRF